MSAHPWSLVAPWYRWDRYPATAPRATPPVLQKYETSKLVDLFRDNPQHSLKFTPEDTTAKGRRKLYLAEHKRFYLVSCELHCDRFGFPNAGTDDVCQAGFVVRRRRTPVPEELAQEASRLMHRIGKRRTQIAMLQNRCHHAAGGGAIAVAKAGQAIKREARARERLLELQADLERFTTTHRLEPVLEGWSATELEGVGTWSRIADGTPEAGEEQVFGLFALVPDPRARPHAARGRALYFGLVPTASSDTQPDGSPRFDAATSYELHCFVRRHDPRCPRRPGRGRDCRGELTWSVPSEPFTLASPQDLVGTSNRPVTVQMPDIPALVEQARGLPFGAGAPLRMATPAGSDLPVDFGADGVAKAGTPLARSQICSFAIPLITIVAYFVLRLFLPIVVLLFGLWVLLKLKFCIPPAIDLGADMTAELQASKAGIEVDAGVAVAKMLPGFPKMPGDGYDGRSFGAMGTGQPIGDVLEVFMAQQREPSAPGFDFPPPLPAGAIASPNSALAPLVWEDELPIPELQEIA